MLPSKNLTAWQPQPSNPGMKDTTVAKVGNAFTVDNSGNFMVNTQITSEPYFAFMVTTPYLTVPGPLSSWTETPAR